MSQPPRRQYSTQAFAILHDAATLVGRFTPPQWTAAQRAGLRFGLADVADPEFAVPEDKQALAAAFNQGLGDLKDAFLGLDTTSDALGILLVASPRSAPGTTATVDSVAVTSLATHSIRRDTRFGTVFEELEQLFKTQIATVAVNNESGSRGTPVKGASPVKSGTPATRGSSAQASPLKHESTWEELSRPVRTKPRTRTIVSRQNVSLDPPSPSPSPKKQTNTPELMFPNPPSTITYPSLLSRLPTYVHGTVPTGDTIYGFSWPTDLPTESLASIPSSQTASNAPRPLAMAFLKGVVPDMAERARVSELLMRPPSAERTRALFAAMGLQRGSTLIVLQELVDDDVIEQLDLESLGLYISQTQTQSGRA